MLSPTFSGQEHPRVLSLTEVEESRTVVYFLLASFHALWSLKQVGEDEQAFVEPWVCKRLLRGQFIQEL